MVKLAFTNIRGEFTLRNFEVAFKDLTEDGGILKEYRYFDTKYEKVENVVGMKPKDARNKLKMFNIEYSGTGDEVISMSPEAGSWSVVGSTVRLMLG